MEKVHGTAYTIECDFYASYLFMHEGKEESAIIPETRICFSANGKSKNEAINELINKLIPMIE